MSQSVSSQETPRLYDEEGDLLVQADKRADRIILLPSGDPRSPGEHRDRIRIQWGHHLLADMVSQRYRTLVCGVNPEDNSHGIVGMLAELLPTSQWNKDSITTHAKTFSQSVPEDEVLVLKYDMDAVTILAILRPAGRDYFTLNDLRSGFRRVAEMTETRYDRQPTASVSFLGAKSNRLLDENNQEPSFESVLRVMYDAGYRGDVYPSLGLWDVAPTGVFATYPFPQSIDAMRAGGF